MDIDAGTPLPDADFNDPREEMLRRVVERPDGLHWLALDGQQEFVLSEGQFAVVTAFTRETAAAPTLEFEVRYRSSRTE